jgi:ABC-type polysaccharide/polyol phosphate transport system ATPase subunit
VSTQVGQAAISVRDLSKRYNIETAAGTGSLRDRFGRSRLPARSQDEAAIWALHHVSFDVPSGRVIGVLGRNGSGKTTLMRILARVTAPTQGSAEVWGRVGALFSLGAGFHPELSGRDNIMLSGAILGMDDETTRRLFDEIVDFSEIGDFLETPVKHYSSGMYMRLAFSVSSHLDADILLIDEALAVGDERFSAKCAERIREMVRTGRTVMLVSHSLDSVAELCDSAIVLEKGELALQGTTDDAIALYHELAKTPGEGPNWAT